MNEPTKRKLLIGLIALSAAPTLLLVPLPANLTLKAASLYVSQISGYIGLMLLLWMYILGARSVFALWFRDLAPVLKIHKWLGKYGSLAVFLHPLLVTYYYGESLFYSAIPYIGTEFERHITLGRIAFSLMVVVWVTSVLMRKNLEHRPWKYLHFLAYISLPFALLHIPGVGSGFEASQALKAYYFLILVVLGIFTLLRLRGLIDSDKAQYVVSRHGKIADDTYLLELTPKDGSWLTPKTGQYVYLKVGALSEDHPFSVLEFNPKTGSLTLGYRVFGRFTKFLRTQKAGTIVRLSGPYGNFLTGIDTDSAYVCIAGGIGITPFVSPLLEQDGREKWLLYANRVQSSSTFSKQLHKALGDHYVGVFSRENESSLGTQNCYIDADLMQSRLGDVHKYHYYLCGPESMVSSVEKALKNLNVSPQKIHVEAFEF